MLQNITVVLLQNATKVYYKVRHVFCYKMGQFLLQNALVEHYMLIKNCKI